MIDATIGSALTKRREGLMMSRVHAAEKVGMSRTTYSSYERDEQRPSVDVFPALAAFLDVSIEEFLTLYASTVIAALRPSLERVLSGQDASSNDPTGTEDESVLAEEEYWLGSPAAIPTSQVIQERPRVPEIPEVPRVPDVPNLPEVPDAPDAPDAPSEPDVPTNTSILGDREIESFHSNIELPKGKKKKGKKKKGKRKG